jgi:hypothetical protein
MSDTSKNWFEIDHKGLAKLIKCRGKHLHERIGSAFDTGVRNQPQHNVIAKPR